MNTLHLEMMTLKMLTIKKCFILLCILQLTVGYPLLKENKPRDKRDINAIQEKLIQTLNPQPILDTISKAEKCCNNVQHELGKKAVDAYDQISGVLANVLQFPKQKVNAIGKSITDVLNQIGGKLVGLQ